MRLEFKWLNQTIKEPVRDQKLSIADNIHINSDIIKHIDPEQLSEKELFDICSDFNKISAMLFKDQDTMLRLLANEKFVTVLTQVLYKMNLEEYQRIQICNTVYNLQRQTNTKINHPLLVNLAKVVNKDVMPRIMELGFKEDLAAAICIARFSSSNSMEQIKRINWQIINVSEELITEPVIKTYEALGYFSKFTELFNGIMYNCIIQNTLNETQQYNYSIISTALYEMLDGIPMELCYSLLRNFIWTRQFNGNLPLRLNLNSCSEAYPRLLQVLNALKENEGLIVPFY